ncbi:MAG: tyrosine-protein phosphatase [Chitinispirillaceae bacterium]|nr:tyrosine-protein phosphatase [Chitinispirillaceae bacterium]
MLSHIHCSGKTAPAAVATVMLLLLTLRGIDGSPAADHAADLIIPPDNSTTADTRPSDDPFIPHTDDLSIPGSTHIEWSLSGASGASSYDVYLSEDSCIDMSDLIASACTRTALPVWNLKIGTTYYWQIRVNDSDGTARTTNRLSFSTPMLWPRMIYLDGTTNVRDIGGRKNKDGTMIRQGLFYRSAEFNQNHVLTEKGMQQVMDLGIACEIDLRNDFENPRPVLPPSVHYFRPQGPDGGGLSAYQYGLRYNGPQYRDVFREIARKENYPVICHCRAGADRAGTVTALLEAILGCTEQQINENYVWTSLSVYGLRDSADFTWEQFITEIKSHDQTYGSLLTGACNYLMRQGLTMDEIHSIRAVLLGESPPPDPVITFTIMKTAKILYVNNPLPRTGRDITELAVYSLSGEKLYDFNRENCTSTLNVTLPRFGAGVRIVRWSEEKTVRGLPAQ